jgi:hypothetical protein
MSQLGQKLPLQLRSTTSGLHLTTDVTRPSRHVGFVPDSEVAQYEVTRGMLPGLPTREASQRFALGCRALGGSVRLREGHPVEHPQARRWL